MIVTRVYGIKMYDQSKQTKSFNHDKIFMKHAVRKEKLEISEELKKSTVKVDRRNP